MNNLGIEVREACLKRSHIREDHQRSQCDQDPRPGAERVVHHVEEQAGTQCVFFIFSRQESLSHVATAAGFGTWVIRAPPGHQEGYQEDRHDHIVGCGCHIGDDVHLGLNAGIRQELAQTTHLGKPHDMHRRPDGTHHRDDELYQVGEQHPGESTDHAVGHGDH